MQHTSDYQCRIVASESWNLRAHLAAAPTKPVDGAVSKRSFENVNSIYDRVWPGFKL